MALKLSNNANGILAMAISNSATSLTLRAGHGSRFPALSSGDWFPITVVRASDPSQFEIMRCTARSGDTLTVERAQEGTSAITFDAGDVVSLRLTAGTLEENFVRRSDLTTSPTDTTPGRVLKVGDFGVGGAAVAVPGNNIDDNTIPTGFYYVTAATSGTKPPGDNGYGYLIVSREGPGTTARQLYLDNDTDRIWTRVWKPSQWSSWKEVYHSGNIAQLISDANLVQTSRTISAGTGLTGGGDLSANRTISLAHSHWPIGVGQTWQNVTSQRALNTYYTNTTGRPIFVAVGVEFFGPQIGSTYLYIEELRVNSFEIPYPDDYYHMLEITLNGIVPPGSAYKVSTSMENVMTFWWRELR